MTDSLVRMIPFRINVGAGTLAVTEFDSELPFTPTRMFWVSDVDEGTTRGNHAHRECHQLIIAVAGSFKVSTERGEKHEFVLNDAVNGYPSPSLYCPPLTWLTIHDISPGSVILVLASHPYDVSDYIDDREEWARLLAESKTVQHHPV